MQLNSITSLETDTTKNTASTEDKEQVNGNNLVMDVDEEPKEVLNGIKKKLAAATAHTQSNGLTKLEDPDSTTNSLMDSGDGEESESIGSAVISPIKSVGVKELDVIEDSLQLVNTVSDTACGDMECDDTSHSENTQSSSETNLPTETLVEDEPKEQAVEAMEEEVQEQGEESVSKSPVDDPVLNNDNSEDEDDGKSIKDSENSTNRESSERSPSEVTNASDNISTSSTKEKQVTNPSIEMGEVEARITSGLDVENAENSASQLASLTETPTSHTPTEISTEKYVESNQSETSKIADPVKPTILVNTKTVQSAGTTSSNAPIRIITVTRNPSKVVEKPITSSDTPPSASNVVKVNTSVKLRQSLEERSVPCEIKIHPKIQPQPQPSKPQEVITYTMDKKSNLVRKVAPKPTEVNVKASFNIQPPAGTSTSTTTDSPSSQDVKDGHAFLRPMPKMLYQIGLSLMREIVYEGLSDHVGGLRKLGDKKYSDEQYQSLQKSLTNLRKDNEHLRQKCDKVCPGIVDNKRCRFRTESKLALETHMSQAHISQGHRLSCARCNSYNTALPAYFKNHMMDKHALMATIIKPCAFYQCKMCFFEANASPRVESHMVHCSKSFHIANNLKPDGLANTPLGETLFKPSKVVLTTPQQTYTLQTAPSVIARPKIIAPGVYTAPAAHVAPHAHVAPAAPAAIVTVHPGYRPSAPPRSPVPITQIGGKPIVCDVVSCEMCGGLIQGTQALRVHMQWCHNINITHLKAPAFHCPVDSCQKLFWTVQGLAKHTSTCTSMSLLKVPDNGLCCFLCRKPYLTSQVEHLLAKHLNDLKKMVEMKRCVAPSCCTKVFASVDILQSHLAQEHRLKMTGLAGLATASVSNIKFQPFCSICKLKFASSQDFAKHCAQSHVHKCDLCGSQCSTKQGLKEHESSVHPFRFCLVCEKEVRRTVFQQHVAGFHNALRCRVGLKRMSTEDYETYSKKSKLPNWS